MFSKAQRILSRRLAFTAFNGERREFAQEYVVRTKLSPKGLNQYVGPEKFHPAVQEFAKMAHEGAASHNSLGGLRDEYKQVSKLFGSKIKSYGRDIHIAAAREFVKDYNGEDAEKFRANFEKLNADEQARFGEAILNVIARNIAKFEARARMLVMHEKSKAADGCGVDRDVDNIQKNNKKKYKNEWGPTIESTLLKYRFDPKKIVEASHKKRGEKEMKEDFGNKSEVVGVRHEVKSQKTYSYEEKFIQFKDRLAALAHPENKDRDEEKDKETKEWSPSILKPD